MIEKYLQVGAAVFPRVQGIGCAVVTGIEEGDGNKQYTVLTDFGNMLNLTDNEFKSLFQNEKLYTKVDLGNDEVLEFYQDPFNFDLEYRFMRQVELLKAAQADLLAKGLLKAKHIF